MSSKSQNLKRKQKGEFKNIDKLEVEKKIFKTNDKTEVVKKDFKKKFNNNNNNDKDNNNKQFQKKDFQKKDFKGKGGDQKKPYNKDNKDNKDKKQFTKKNNGPTGEFKNRKMNKALVKDEEKKDKEDKEYAPGELASIITMGQINKLVQKLWNKKQTPEKEKSEIIIKIMEKVEPIITQLIQKREGSRAVQACIKYGNEEIQNKVFKIVLKNNFSETVKGKYGHFLCLRMMKAMKSKEIKQEFFEKLLKDAFYLVSHVEGAKVIDQYMRNLAKPSELTAIKKVFDEAAKKTANLKKDEKVEGIENLALKIVDKANHYPLISKYILQVSLPIMVAAEREKIIEFLREKVLDLIEDKEGVKLCLDLINYASAKDRKIIVRNFKDHVMKMVNSQSNLAFMIIQKLIHSLDDTVLVEKQIIKPIKTELTEVMKTKHGFNIISSIFTPKHNAVSTLEKTIAFTTSKKDDDIRLGQLQGTLIQEVVDLLKTYEDKDLLTNFANSRFLSSVLKYILKENKSEYFDFVKNVLNKFTDESQFQNQQSFETSLINHIDAHRILKSVISLSGELSEKSKDLVDEYVEKINKLCSNNIELFVKNKSSIYIVISLIEQTSFKDFVIQQVKGLNMKQIQTQKTDGKDSVGFEILKKFL